MKKHSEEVKEILSARQALSSVIRDAVVESFSDLFLPSQEPTEFQVDYVSGGILLVVEKHLKLLRARPRTY